MKKILPALAVVCLVAAVPAMAQQQVQVKLGTLAPNGSTWHELLKEMAEKWTQASNGTVKLRVYAGGTQGNEGEMVRKMAVGQLQGAAVTSVGLHDIIAEPQALAAPLMFDSAAELQSALRGARAEARRASREEGLRGAHLGSHRRRQALLHRSHSRRRPRRPGPRCSPGRATRGA